jgi:hypothetical protein
MTPRREDIRERLLPRLRAWSRHGIHIGLSPRTPPPWSALLDPAHDGSLRTYAKFFDTALLHVGPGFVLDAATLARMQQETHEDFGWTVVLADEHMLYRFPYGHPDRNRRGALNPRFLDPGGTAGAVTPLLQQCAPHVRAVVLCIGPIHRTEALRFEDFHDAVVRCLDALPPECRYAVETARTDFVLPAYRESLRARNVARVLTGPQLLNALQMPGACTGGLCVLRSACLAAEEEGEEWLGVRETIRRCLDEGTTLYAYCGGAADGGPEELVRLLAGLDGELARRSPIRRRAA